MFEEFLNKLEENATRRGLSDADTAAVVEKYKRRFALAKEAGFSESEAIDKFGSPEKIVDEALKSCASQERTGEKSCENGCENGCGSGYESCKSGDCSAKAGECSCESDYAVIADEFYLENISDNVNVVIAPSDEAGVKTVFDGNVADFYKAKFSDDGFRYEFVPRDENVLKKNKAKGTVHILIDKKLFFKRIEISAACGGDFDSLKYDFNTDEFSGEFVAGDAKLGNITAKDCSISSVSGDFVCGAIKSGACKISGVSGDVIIDSVNANAIDFNTVSGDVIVKKVKASKAKLKTVSGDILLDGEVGGYEANTVSGDISVNSKVVCENLANKVSRSLGNFFKSFGKGSDKNDD